MDPFFTPNDLVMFYKYLDKTANYFEYGSGGSTYQAYVRDNIKTITSIESDPVWYNKLKISLEDLKSSTNLNLIFCDMDTQPDTWGKPGENSTLDQWINYSSQIQFIEKNLAQEIDLILIDGRFRVACCLKCFDIISDNCFIAFDDFLIREHYHSILEYYNIIEHTDDNRMVILQKKTNIESPTEDIISKWEISQN